MHSIDMFYFHSQSSEFLLLPFLRNLPLVQKCNFHILFIRWYPTNEHEEETKLAFIQSKLQFEYHTSIQLKNEREENFVVEDSVETKGSSP
jgi:hypothetical protein